MNRIPSRRSLAAIGMAIGIPAAIAVYGIVTPAPLSSQDAEWCYVQDDQECCSGTACLQDSKPGPKPPEG